jgi:hypothetical protein
LSTAQLSISIKSTSSAEYEARTALAALEQIDLLGQHDDAGLRAIGVLRGIVLAMA